MTHSPVPAPVQLRPTALTGDTTGSRPILHVLAAVPRNPVPTGVHGGDGPDDVDRVHGVAAVERGDRQPASHRDDWVLAAPFRAHVRGVLCETGLPWRALAVLAGVPPRVVHSLVFGTPTGALRRLRAVDAELLLQVDAPLVLRLARVPVRPDAVAARIGLLRRITRDDDPRVARWLHVTPEQLDALAAGRGWCSHLTLLLAAAALSAHGVDGFWALQHLEGRLFLPGCAEDAATADDGLTPLCDRDDQAAADRDRKGATPLLGGVAVLTHCAA